MSRLARQAAVGLVLANSLFWAVCIIGREPLGSDYFRERDSRYRATPAGFELRLLTDVDPMLVLVERGFAYPMYREPLVIHLALLLNLPAFFLASLATEGLTTMVLSARAAAAVGTIVFGTI